MFLANLKFVSAIFHYFWKNNVLQYSEKKFNVQLFYLPIVSQTFVLSWATTRCPPS